VVVSAQAEAADGVQTSTVPLGEPLVVQLPQKCAAVIEIGKNLLAD
jgi:hypothetical protein